MKNSEKLILSIIAGWITLHIFIFTSIKPNSCLDQHHEKFWPFDGGIVKCTYDKTELMTYILTPIIMYLVYKILSLIKTTKK